MKLESLVEVSERIRSTARKKEKVSIITQLLRQLRGREISLAAHYLSGNLLSGKIGIGWRTIQNAKGDTPVSLLF